MTAEDALRRVEAAIEDLDGWYEQAIRHSKLAVSKDARTMSTGRTLAYARAIETLRDAINPPRDQA